MKECRITIRITSEIVKRANRNIFLLEIEEVKKRLQEHMKSIRLSYNIMDLGPCEYEDAHEFVVTATRSGFDLRTHVEKNMKKKGLL